LSPSPEHVEYAEMLLRRANGDLYACRVLHDDADVHDGPIGFHAQQAVEKALKIALVFADVELPHTNDLEFIARLARKAGVDLPSTLDDIGWLSAWASDSLDDEPTDLDRAAALSVAELAIGWAGALLAEQSGAR
jgi:HEPN domain-containing protein